MPTVRYIGPIDEVEAVGVGVFKHGDELEVTAEQAKGLLAQHDNFEAVNEKKKG
jgi:hypothetical protein